MARNEEKAQAMLNRYLRAKEEAKPGFRKERPRLATSCFSLRWAHKWRRDILKEISGKITEIQNELLGENKIRDLNDSINKLIREKGHWEDRIVELGGENFKAHVPTVTDAEGNMIEISPGYKYFGAARNLPGVAEIIAAQTRKGIKRRRVEAVEGRNLGPDYYGEGSETQEMLEAEAAAEERARQKVLAKYILERKTKLADREHRAFTREEKVQIARLNDILALPDRIDDDDEEEEEEEEEEEYDEDGGHEMMTDV